MYAVYFIDEQGYHEGPTRVEDSAIALNMAMKNSNIFHEVMICDDDDFCLFHVIGGKLIFPTEEVMKEHRQNREV